MPHATLSVDLAAIRRNYAALKTRFGGSRCAAVVKANAYGLGATEVTRALIKEDCTEFFVATLEEAIALRKALGDVCRVYVFNGISQGDERDYHAHNLIPVLNDPSQLHYWNIHGKGHESALHIDSGMNRLGLTEKEYETLATQPELPKVANVKLILSHLACAGEPEHTKNAEQLAYMQRVKTSFPGIPISLCNSSGIFLDKNYHFDVARPGCSLYGITPRSATDNPMENVVHLHAPILQLRTIDRAGTVGYGATHPVAAGSRIATLGMGYADGYHRRLSGTSHAYIGDVKVPVIGRVSMDMISVDVTGVPERLLDDTCRVELIGPHVPVDVLADLAGTIGYEIVTSLGNRVKRIYTH